MTTENNKKESEVRKRALNFAESLSASSHENRTDIHFSEDSLVSWLVDFATNWLPASQFTASKEKEYREALEKAIEIIKGWHDLKGFDRESNNKLWKAYYDLSPEMKPIRKALIK